MLSPMCSSSVRRGLADSCETDRQEAAQRNRCTVMVAAVVGGCILQQHSTLSANWAKCRKQSNCIRCACFGKTQKKQDKKNADSR